MEMNPVKSSNITHIGHDGTTMRVTYKSGDTYEFNGIPPHDHAKLMAADSKGSHLFKMGVKGVKVKK
jgi:KTSC domain